MIRSKSILRKQVNILIDLIIKVRDDDIFALSSQLAYYLVLSFFPFIVFLITLVGFSNISSADVMEGLSAILPESIYEITESLMREIFDQKYTELLGVSILLSLWTSSAAFRAVINGVNKAYNIKESRSFIKRIFISMSGIFLLALVMILALSMLVFGEVIENYIKSLVPLQELMVIIWNAFRHTLIFVVMIFIFASVYKFTPNKVLSWKVVIPGAIFSTFGWLITSIGFSFYISNFNNYSRFYGSLGAVFILMTWLFLVSMIFILGVEINCVIAQVNQKNN